MTRYFVPKFHAENEAEKRVIPLANTMIRQTLEKFGAIRLRRNKRYGVYTFALENDTWINWQNLSDALSSIHPNCVAMSYLPGENLNSVFGQVEN